VKAGDVMAFAWMEPDEREAIARSILGSRGDHAKLRHWASHVYSGAP
jgi:hypothetical protein